LSNLRKAWMPFESGMDAYSVFAKAFWSTAHAHAGFSWRESLITSAYCLLFFNTLINFKLIVIKLITKNLIC
jgi:hypothetical protein